MKKLFSIAFAFIAFMAISQAQIGFRGGINLANIAASIEDVDVEFDTRLGLQLGVTYSAAINENISFRPGILFSQKGAKIEFLDEDFGTSLSYLEVPLDFVYNANKLSVHAGPYLALLIAADAGGEDVKDQTNSLDFGLNVGLGYMINTNIGVGVNYGLGLSDLAKESVDGSSSKNKNISIYLTYAL